MKFREMNMFFFFKGIKEFPTLSLDVKLELVRMYLSSRVDRRLSNFYNWKIEGDRKWRVVRKYDVRGLLPEKKQGECLQCGQKGVVYHVGQNAYLCVECKNPKSN